MSDKVKSPEKIKNFSVSQYAGLGDSLNKQTQQISQTDTIEENSRHYFISMNRALLSYMYINFGLVQVLVDQPVDDAFRGGIDIKSDELDDEDIDKLQDYLSRNETLKEVKQLAKWTRLYGGGGMVINADGKADEDLRLDEITEDSRLEFYAADLWELSIRNAAVYGDAKPYEERSAYDDEQFFFYGNSLNKSRVIKTSNKAAPSFLRPILRGWGMSELERVVRELNTYLKNSTLGFELLDEAKVDVMKIEGFNNSMMDSQGVTAMLNRLETALKIKNFQSALIMDKEDDFEQKQLSFAGLSDMAVENRIGIASCMRMPITKVFGISSAGFNSGEDEIENYNSMIESEIRREFDKPIIDMLRLICKKELGFVPENLSIEYKPLRILKSTEEEEVKDRQLRRLLDLYDRALITSSQLADQLNIANITPNHFDTPDEDFPLPPFEQPNLDFKDDEINVNKEEKIKNSKKFFKWLKN